MFPSDIWFAYTLACVLLVLSPGPDNLLAIGRGLSQGRLAACVSGFSSGAGTACHVLAATFGLTVLMQTSALVFWIVKLVGAAYLLWLGLRVLRSRNLVNFEPAARASLPQVASTAFLSATLNPKPGLFVLAFIPQFIDPARGSVSLQMLGYGGWFALLTALGFAAMGMSAAGLTAWLRRRPRVIAGVNIGAGLAFVGSGLAVVALKQK
jgi:threonine/homoserine/homoserine lactone efflux protein